MMGVGIFRVSFFVDLHTPSIIALSYVRIKKYRNGKETARSIVLTSRNRILHIYVYITLCYYSFYISSRVARKI